MQANLHKVPRGQLLWIHGSKPPNFSAFEPCLLWPASAAETGSLTQHIPPAMWHACFLPWKSSKYHRNSILGIQAIVFCWLQIQFTPFSGKGCFFPNCSCCEPARLEKFLFRDYHWWLRFCKSNWAFKGSSYSNEAETCMSAAKGQFGHRDSGPQHFCTTNSLVSLGWVAQGLLAGRTCTQLLCSSQSHPVSDSTK